MSLAIVTGASRGIGRELALRLARRGYTVAAMSRTASELASLAAEQSGIVAVPLDITDLDAVTVAVDALQAEHGPCAVLVNNAGFGLRGVIEEIDLEAWRGMFELNVFAAMHLTQAVLPAMRRSGSGTIVQLSSIAARVSVPMSGAYCATKFALRAASDALRVEVAPFGIDVIQIEPGPVRTAFAKVAADNSAELLTRESSPYRPVYQAFTNNLSELHAHAWSVDDVVDRVEAALDKGKAPVRVRAFGWLLRASEQASHFWPRLHDRLVGKRMGVDELG